MKKIGLTLSGGGVRGFFHAGFVQALKERQIAIALISGTSAGAIAGALLAADVDIPSAVEDFPKRLRTLFFDPHHFMRTRLNPAYVLRNYLDKLLRDKTFSDLSIPTHLVAINAGSGELEIFNSDHDQQNVLEAVMASCAIPGVFNEMTRDNQIYFDGGLVNNLPSDIIREQCDVLIGVNLLPFAHKTFQVLPGRRKLLYRSVEIFHHHLNKQALQLCDLVVSPRALLDYPTYQTANKMKLYAMGYDSGQSIDLDKYLN